jgi:cell division protein FtsL
VLVQVQYESRRLYTESSAHNEARDRGEHERLQEKARPGHAGAGERLAKDQLHMKPATPAITQYVTLKGTAPATAETAP